VKLDITWFNAPAGGYIVAWVENDEFHHEHVETAEEAMRLVGARKKHLDSLDGGE